MIGRPACPLAPVAALLAALAVAPAAEAGKKDDGMAPSVIAIPPLRLPQAKIDRVDVSAWPKVTILATVLDGRGAPVEIKGLARLDVLDGTKKAPTASKNNPAWVSFEAGQALHRRKDAKLAPRAEAGIGLGAIVVVQGYKDTVDATVQQQIREAAAAAFKPLGKGDRANVVWYNDRITTTTGVRNLDTRLVDVENADVLGKCAAARREARALVAPTLGPPPGKDAPAPPPGTDLCGLQADASKLTALVARAEFEGAFPRLFNLGERPFWDTRRYCASPPGKLKGFEPFGTPKFAEEVREQEDRILRGTATDYRTSAIDTALSIAIRDGRPGEETAIVVLSDGRDGWVADLKTCADHPPPPCKAFDATVEPALSKLASIKGDKAQAAERYRLAVDLRACVEREQFLTKRVAETQKHFHDRARQWIGLARAANVRFHAVGLRRDGVVTNPFELERLRLLAEKTGGTYREVGHAAPAIPAVNRTMAEAAGQLAITFTHPNDERDAIEEAGPTVSYKLAVALDRKLEREDNPGTQLTTEPLASALPVQPGIGVQLREVGWGLLVRIQLAIGYDAYVVVGWVLAVGALLLALLITIKLVRRLLRPKAAG